MLAATAQNEHHHHAPVAGPSKPISDGFLTCYRDTAGLLITQADGRFCQRLGLSDHTEIAGAALAEALGNRLGQDQLQRLASAVAQEQRITLELRGADSSERSLRLHLTPTSFEGVWIGALEATRDREFRIEFAGLHPHPQFLERHAQLAGADTEADESIPPVPTILDGVRSLIGIRDSAGRYLLVNSTMAEFYGVSPSAFLGKTPEQLGMPDAVLAEPAPRASTAPMIARDVELTDATGRHRRFDIAWRQVPSGDHCKQYLLEVATEAPVEPPPRSIGVAARVAGAHTKLELVLRGANLVLFDWNVATDEVLGSPRLAELLELDEASVPSTATGLTEFIDPRDRARFDSVLRAHLAGETEELHCEFRLKSAKGRVRWVIASGNIVERGQTGEPLAYLGTLQDVTEMFETSQELQRQLARSQEAMRTSEELAREVRQLEAEIREISQREHERLGHDLHDGLGQELTGVSLLLKSLEDAIERDAPQLRTRLHSVRDMVEQSIATTRALAQGLSPVHLDRDGFAGALEQLAASSQTLYGIPVRYTVQRNAPLPQELAGASDLFRIAQEAVRNAARHAGASEIRVNLTVDEDQLVVTVEDNGHGMPQSARANAGMGLKIMRYRASIVGASLEIGAREGGRGTVVRCTLRHSREGVT